MPAPEPAPAPPPRPVVRTDVFAGIAPALSMNSKPALTVDTGTFLPAAVAEAALLQKTAKTWVFGSTQVRETAAPLSQIVPAGFAGAQAATPPAAARRDPVTGHAGFGAAIVSAAAPAVLPPAVHAGGFGSVSVQGPAARRQAEQARSPEVEILFKPKPVYSEEARKLRLEGEVLVEVVFAASGKVEVRRVAKGLGHGLDESALRAAANIRFRPAEQGGRPVDSPALVRILFSLAY